uniref:Serpentine receptor class gamma n=1 Tax=Meloidogyne floridensis TaxID=298350 RepID=A0A915P512_9BILA
MNTTWVFNFFTTLSQSVIPPNVFALLIVIPSATLYITELGVIFRFKKTFKSSFFKLFAARTISIWNKLWYWAIILAYLLPLTLSWHILISETVIWVHDNETFSLYTQMKPDEPKDTLTTSWFSVLFTIICLLINIACIYVYRKTKIASSQQTQSKQKTETLLTFYSLLTFFGQLLFTFYTIILYISSSQLQKFVDPDLAELIFLSIYNQYSWVNDISTIAIPAFLLLWASEMMRSRIYSLIQIICFLPKNTNNNAIMVIPKQERWNFSRQPEGMLSTREK